MKLNKILTAAAIVFAVSCSSPEELRFFMPTATLEVPESVDAESGVLPVTVVLSKAAEIDTEVAVKLAGDAREGENFELDSYNSVISKGNNKTVFNVRILNEKIFTERLDFTVLLAAGKSYSLENEKDGYRKVAVTKVIRVPLIKVTTEDLCLNPYLSPVVHLNFAASMPVREEIRLKVLDLDGFEGFNAGEVVIPVGSQEASLDVRIDKIDQSGYDRTVRFALERNPAVYVPEAGFESADVRLYDPVPDFSPLWRTYAGNDGKGYQQRQSIMGSDGEWKGNKVLDMHSSSEGSNYLRPYKNMYKSSWNCMSNNTGGDVLMLTEFVPDLAYPNEYTIADYGNNSSAKGFTSCDSLFRFVADYQDIRKGTMHLDSPRKFTAFVALRSEWDGGTSPDKGWQVDSRATGGNILASTSPLITDRIDVELVRLEGKYDLTNLQTTFEFTAWLKSDNELFMRNVNTETYDIVKENDGTWKVKYRIYPR